MNNNLPSLNDHSTDQNKDQPIPLGGNTFPLEDKITEGIE